MIDDNLTQLWINVIKEKEIEECDNDIQILYKYTIDLQKQYRYFLEKYFDCEREKVSNVIDWNIKQALFLEFLEDEIERLATSESSIYKDDLDNICYVNEDIFNEVYKILHKFSEILLNEVI